MTYWTTQHSSPHQSPLRAAALTLLSLSILPLGPNLAKGLLATSEPTASFASAKPFWRGRAGAPRVSTGQ
jgi:hypothetical protein